MKKTLTILKYAGAAIIALMILVITFFGGRPPYVVAGITIENIHLASVKSQLEAKINDFKNKKIQITYGGKTIYVEPEMVDAQFYPEQTIERLKKFGKIGFFVGPVYEPMGNSFDENKLLLLVKTEFKDEIREMKEASIKSVGKNLIIESEQIGSSLDEKSLKENVKNIFDKVAPEKIELKFDKKQPTITAEDLKVNFDRISMAINKNISVKYDQKSYEFYPKSFLDSIYFEKVYKIIDQGGESGKFIGYDLKIKLNSEKIKTNFIANLAQAIDKKSSSVNIYKAENGKVVIEGKGDIGEEIDQDKLLELMEIAINQNVQIVKIPIIQTPSQVSISQDLQAMGVKELIGVGHTSFYNSPANRAHNIKNGISKFNGILIAPDEVFSFNKTLGRVDDTTGYLKELVIKPEGTIPEYGGGLCQVSTTMYRAAIYTGLPIVERSPHSYAVTYYSQIGGHGLDATIYPGARDLRFKNDTQGHILVQSYVSGMEAFYKFYGTSDGRKIEMDGPYLGNYKDAGAEQLIKTKSLAPGERKMIEHAGKGFSAAWYRTITNINGEVKKEPILSEYRATANRYMVGMTTEELAGQPQQGVNQAVTPGEFKD